MPAGSNSVLIDALNRLGGRQAVPAASRDLIAAAPHDMPLVAVRPQVPAVLACDVAAFMARAPDLEPEALRALATLVAHGVLAADADPGADPSLWVTADRRGVARQAVQWVLDHPEHGLQAEAFGLARRALS